MGRHPSFFIGIPLDRDWEEVIYLSLENEYMFIK
jgi:hypothetical protein